MTEDDFEIKSKIYSLKLRLVLNYILNSQDVLYFRNLFFTLFFLNCRLVMVFHIQHYDVILWYIENTHKRHYDVTLIYAAYAKSGKTHMASSKQR